MQKKNFTQKIIQWYRENKRNLPWRDTTDPYNIWLSEIILQQTRVAQGIPYYLKFVDRFPSVQSLAAASEQDVLRLWQGLGYYTRARNLHRCAKIVVSEHAGIFPASFKELLTLPGIGTYTAAAIASIAFQEPVAVVDGNVYRVLSRIFGIEKDISANEGKDYFFSFANQLISKDDPADFNQGMMEFGAIWCLPQNPKCEECVFRQSCVAFKNNAQALLPVKTKKTKVRKRYVYYMVIRQNEKLAMQKREGKDIWQGLYDFYSVESSRPQKLSAIIEQSDLSSKIKGPLEIGPPSAVYKHVLSHQTISARFIPITIKTKTRLFQFYTSAEINELPKPVLVSRHLADIDFL